jgi:hypothetical protein
MTSFLSASNSIFCLGSQILSKLVVIFHTAHYFKFRSNLSIVYIISSRRMKIVYYSVIISLLFYTSVQVNLQYIKNDVLFPLVLCRKQACLKIFHVCWVRNFTNVFCVADWKHITWKFHYWHNVHKIFEIYHQNAAF